MSFILTLVIRSHLHLFFFTRICLFLLPQYVTLVVGLPRSVFLFNNLCKSMSCSSTICGTCIRAFQICLSFFFFFFFPDLSSSSIIHGTCNEAFMIYLFILLPQTMAFVGTMGLGPTVPTSRPRPTKDNRMMTQSTGPTIFLYQSGPNIHPHPGRVYTS